MLPTILPDRSNALGHGGYTAAKAPPSRIVSIFRDRAASATVRRVASRPLGARRIASLENLARCYCHQYGWTTSIRRTTRAAETVVRGETPTAGHWLPPHFPASAPPSRPGGNTVAHGDRACHPSPCGRGATTGSPSPTPAVERNRAPAASGKLPAPGYPRRARATGCHLTLPQSNR